MRTTRTRVSGDRPRRGTTHSWNSLATPITFFVPLAARGGPDRMNAMDSIVVAPGAVGELSTRAAVSGNHIYRATTPTRVANGRGMAGVLTGAMVVVVALSPISDRAVAGGRDSLAVECSRRS